MPIKSSRSSWMLRLAAFALLGLAVPAQAQGPGPAAKWLIDSGDRGESDKLVVYGAWRDMTLALAAQAKIDAAASFSSDATKDLLATRGGTVALISGPAHIIGSALRHGHYLPVAVADRSQRVVLATLAGSGIRDFAGARGKSVGLPSPDSLVTYLMRGEANAAGTSLKQHFSRIYYTQYQEALLNALKFGTTDLVAVDEALFERWRAAGEPVAEVMKTKESPGLGVVAHKALGKATIRSLQDALAGRHAPVPGLAGVSFRPLEASAYEYVATLGYFTPRALEGTQLVDARTAQQLVARGVPLFDGRTEEEFRAGRPKGARFLPYGEKSTKDTDFDDAQDTLDVSQLPADKNAEIMFSCGGPECWKSYKSARKAIKQGYKRIYWFRGGIHEWRQVGLPLDQG